MQGIEFYPGHEKLIAYQGTFNNGKQDGYGTSYSDQGFKEYEGQWSNSEKDGQGIEYYDDGERYEGSFVKG